MFRYELVNSTRKFTVVAEIISLLKNIYKKDAPFRAVFKVKTLAVLFSPYPREMKHIPRDWNLPPFWRLLVSIQMVQSISTRAPSHARGLSMRTHLTAVGSTSGIICGLIWGSFPVWGSFAALNSCQCCINTFPRPNRLLLAALTYHESKISGKSIVF